MEDHDGDLVLEDRPGGGARVKLVFHLAEEPPAAPESGKTGRPKKAVLHGA